MHINRITAVAICFLYIFASGKEELEAKCLPIPNLIGKIPQSSQKIKYEYICEDSPDCSVKKTAACLTNKKSSTTKRNIPVEYLNIMTKNKQSCKPITETWKEHLKARHVTLPPETAGNGDIVFAVGGCGVPNPQRILLYNKKGKIKYARIRVLWHLGSKVKSQNINGIIIKVSPADKLGCRGWKNGMCTYSAKFGINKKKITLKPDQIFKGENFILKYLNSVFAENIEIEDFINYLDYEIYFLKIKPEPFKKKKRKI